MVEQAIDFVFEGMVMKVVDSNSEFELVECVEENIAVEKHGKVVDIDGIKDIFHKHFTILVAMVEAKISMAWV